MEEIKNTFGAEMAKALVDFQSQCPPVTYNKFVDYLTKTSGRVKYSYASFDHLLATIRKPMKDNGLAFVQLVNIDTSVTTTLMHVSGEYIQGTCKIPAQSDNPQAVGATISYAKRYGLSAILGISAEEDDEEVASSPAGRSKNYDKALKTQAPQAQAPNTQAPNTQAPKTQVPPFEPPTHAIGGTAIDWASQISKARDMAELNKIFKELTASGENAKPYLPALNKRKNEING